MLYTQDIWKGLAEFKSSSSALLCTHTQIQKIHTNAIFWSTECAHILQGATLVKKHQGFHELIAADVVDVEAVKRLIETRGFWRHPQATSYEKSEV